MTVQNPSSQRAGLDNAPAPAPIVSLSAVLALPVTAGVVLLLKSSDLDDFLHVVQ